MNKLIDTATEELSKDLSTIWTLIVGLENLSLQEGTAKGNNNLNNVQEITRSLDNLIRAMQSNVDLIKTENK